MSHRRTIRANLTFVIFFIIINKPFVHLERHGVKVNKCCEKFEILIDQRCTPVNTSVTGMHVFSNNIFIYLKQIRFDYNKKKHGFNRLAITKCRNTL